MQDRQISCCMQQTHPINPCPHQPFHSPRAKQKEGAIRVVPPPSLEAQEKTQPLSTNKPWPASHVFEKPPKWPASPTCPRPRDGRRSLMSLLPPQRLPMLAFSRTRFDSASTRIVLVVLTWLLELRKPSGGWPYQRLINDEAAPRLGALRGDWPGCLDAGSPTGWMVSYRQIKAVADLSNLGRDIDRQEWPYLSDISLIVG